MEYKMMNINFADENGAIEEVITKVDTKNHTSQILK